MGPLPQAQVRTRSGRSETARCTRIAPQSWPTRSTGAPARSISRTSQSTYASLVASKPAARAHPKPGSGGAMTSARRRRARSGAHRRCVSGTPWTRKAGTKASLARRRTLTPPAPQGWRSCRLHPARVRTKSSRSCRRCSRCVQNSTDSGTMRKPVHAGGRGTGRRRWRRRSSIQRSTSERRPGTSGGSARAARSGDLLHAPGEDTRRRHLDDHDLRLLERRLVGILRVLRVEEAADLAEARPLLDEARRALEHHALQVGPVVGVEVDGDGDAGVGLQVPDLPRASVRGEVELPVGEDVADGHEVGRAGGARRRHARDALPGDQLGERFLEPHGRQAYDARAVPVNTCAGVGEGGGAEVSSWRREGRGPRRPASARVSDSGWIWIRMMYADCALSYLVSHDIPFSMRTRVTNRVQVSIPAAISRKLLISANTEHAV